MLRICIPRTIDTRARAAVRKKLHTSVSWLVLYVASVLAAGGCRSLHSGRQTRALSISRQNSLRGAEKLQQNKLQEAEFLFSEALRHSSADERAQSGMAEVLWQRGEAEKAIQHMSQAAAISGENPDYLVRLGEMNFQQGALDQALRQADVALENQRTHAGAWALRGKVLQSSGRLDEAMSCYHRALSYQPASPDVQLALAEIYRDLGRPQRALATLDCMSDGQSGELTCPKAWLLKGQALASLGEPAACRNCLKNAALCADDQDLELLLSLAQYQMEIGEIDEARVCLSRAFRHDPYNPKTRQLQASLDQLAHSGRAEANLIGFERPRRQAPQTPKKFAP